MINLQMGLFSLKNFLKRKFEPEEDYYVNDNNDCLLETNDLVSEDEDTISEYHDADSFYKNIEDIEIENSDLFSIKSETSTLCEKTKEDDYLDLIDMLLDFYDY